MLEYNKARQIPKVPILTIIADNTDPSHPLGPPNKFSFSEQKETALFN